MKPTKPPCLLPLLTVALGVIFLSNCGEQNEKPKRDAFAANHSSWQFIGKSLDNEYYYYNERLVRVTESDTVMLWFKTIKAPRRLLKNPPI
jgi:hypothetical protein